MTSWSISIPENPQQYQNYNNLIIQKKTHNNLFEHFLMVIQKWKKNCNQNKMFLTFYDFLI
jgi:hypothetical protein